MRGKRENKTNTRERDISRKNRHSERSNPHAKQSVEMHPKESRKKVRVRDGMLIPSAQVV
jgi:hypothetical protein